MYNPSHTHINIDLGNNCPECGEDMSPPRPAICTCPNMIYIPPGQHIHVDCPQHGKRKIYGSGVTWSINHQYNALQ